MPREARRLLGIYQRRLRSNLLAPLRVLVGAGAPALADSLGAMIDGVYLREALAGRAPDRAAAAKAVEGAFRAALGGD